MNATSDCLAGHLRWPSPELSVGTHANSTSSNLKTFLPPANEVCEGYVFTGVCLSTWGGVCVVAPGGACVVAPGGGMRGCSWGVCGCSGGHAWLLLGGHVWLLPGGLAWLLWGACMVAPRGGMHGCSQGACMAKGGMRGEGGHAWWRGACVAKGACMAKEGHAWYEWPVIAQVVHILLECILVKWLFEVNIYCLQTKLREGNIITGVCLSVILSRGRG